MSLFKFLFGKKKKASASFENTEEGDGQEQFLIAKEPKEEPPAPPTVKERKPAPVIIPGDKVKIEGSGGRTLKEAVRGGWVEKKSTNTVIRKVGGFVVNTPAEAAPTKNAETVKKEAIKPEKQTVKKEAVKPEKATVKKAAAKAIKDSVKKPLETQAVADKKVDKKPKTAPTKKAVAKPEKAPIQEANTEDGVVVESKATRSGKFELKKAKDGRFFFNLYASNHTVIAFSQVYSSSSSALNGIKSVIANAGTANIEDTTLKNPASVLFPKWEIYIDKANQYRFRLYAGNGNCVCHAAHGYATKSGCKGGIDSIIRFSAEARIDKKYLTK